MHDLSGLEDRVRLIAYLYRTVSTLARQAAETPPFEHDSEVAWEAARPELLAAGSYLVEAIDKRLTGQDGAESVELARSAVGRFSAAAPREHHAVALAAVLEDLLNDVEGWRPSNRVDPDRLLVVRILTQLGGQRLLRRPITLEGQLEFEEELSQSRLRDLTGTLRRRERTAPVLADVVEAAAIAREVDLGVQDIPLAQIKGSESRTVDFDVAFMPRKRDLRPAWVQLYAEMEEGRPVEPLDVYKVGKAYFVRHGHHRVSVARRLGRERIPANVIEVTTRAPVGSELGTRELLHAAEYAEFLERTQLDRARPEARLACGELGRYDLILDHIEGHRYFLGMEWGQEVALPDAAASWYDSVYTPLTEVARAHDMQRKLRGWTDADIYLALSRLWLDLDTDGRPAGPERAAQALLEDPHGVKSRAPGRGIGKRPRGQWRFGRRIVT